jgi:phospholipase/lecithinase/hemolysin
MGKVARGLSLMRTNEVGRFSDRKNWTDFLWEWSGGQTMIWRDKTTSNTLTSYHRQLKSATHGSPSDNPFIYVNYAEGGAMGASDRGKTGLGTFVQQKDKFLSEVSTGSESTLYIVWFGLNDLVTNKRNKEDMKAVVEEQLQLCRDVQKAKNGHFLLLNIPNPQGAVRFVGKEYSEEVTRYQYGAFEYGYHMAQCINNNAYRFPPDTIHLLDIYSFFEEVNSNLGGYGLRAGAQPHGVKVRYYTEQPYLGGLKVRFDTRNAQQERITVEGTPMAAELETKYLTVYERDNPSHRGSRSVQIEMIRKEIRAGSSDEVVYAAAKATRDKAAADTGTFGRSALRDVLDKFLRQSKYADYTDPNTNWTTTSDEAHPTEAVYKLVAKYVVKHIRDAGYELGTLNRCSEADFQFTTATHGKCPGCTKEGHDADAVFCKYCGARLS